LRDALVGEQEGDDLQRDSLKMLAIVVVAILTLSQQRLPAATVTVGGPFTLAASDGTTVSDATYRGKWLLVFFGYTFCPNICPTTLLEVADALRRLGPDASELQPLFISIDPDRDTPDVMAAYTRSFDLRIVGLTGTVAQIASVAKEYGAYYAPHRTGPGVDDYVMDHGTYLYLMDPNGQFVRGFDADTQGAVIADKLREMMARLP
jgi:protein SCO1/2